MIHTEWPDFFEHDFEAVGCFFEVGPKILLLLRSASVKIEPNKWGIPGGKVGKGEIKERAIAREFFEETGLDYPSDSFEFLRTVFMEYPRISFLYHIFRKRMRFSIKGITLSREHEKYKWVDYALAAQTEDLMLHEDDCIKLVYNL